MESRLCFDGEVTPPALPPVSNYFGHSHEHRFTFSSASPGFLRGGAAVVNALVLPLSARVDNKYPVRRTVSLLLIFAPLPLIWYPPPFFISAVHFGLFNRLCAR